MRTICCAKMVQFVNRALYHKNTHYQLNYLTMSVKDPEIVELLTAQRVSHLERIYVLSWVGAILTLVSQLVSY